MIIDCPNCGSENDARRRFCGDCGGGLELLCLGCGFSNRVGDRFCGGCGIQLVRDGQAPTVAQAAAGEPVVAEPPATLDEAKRDELRTITVMMADLDGFAEMTDVHGRERQTQVMNEVFERLAETHIVDEFDGYIDKFLDGDIMALFGAPIAHEDAPERALRAAVRMHQELDRLHAEEVIPPDTPLRLRIGINTGPVRVGGVGAGGRMEYTAMGDTVNLSARLMTACAWGTTLISVNTHRRVAGSFELDELEPVSVKGKSEPVKIWAVLAEKRRAARVELAQAEGMSRLIGRDAQLEAILDRYQHALDGTGGAIGIRGEAGIGKSRLVFELQQKVEETKALFLEGRCLSYGVNISFLPLREVLSELFGLDDADSATVRREKIEAWLAAQGLDAAALAPPLGFIVLGQNPADKEFNNLDPQALQARLREATFQAVEAVCARQPLVLFVDDLQWCDADSLLILDDLVARCPESRMMLALAFRPDFQHEWGELPQFTAIAPPRLTVEETRVMVGSLLHQRGFIEDEARIEESLALAVFHKSQGNPFFIDQTVTALVERAQQSGRPTIDFRRGRLLISEDELGDLVPDSVEEILLARIDRLPEEPRSLLQAASVAMIGRYFRRSALEFCVGRTDLDGLLSLLTDRELVRLERTTDEDTEYVFEHALARDVAYNNLLRSERRLLHGRVGEYIEQHYANSLNAYVDDLSYHFYNSEDAARALHYLPQSAARAERSYSNAQAILHYKRALEKADELGRDGGSEGLPRLRLEALKGLTKVQVLISDREALEYGQQRLALAHELHDRDAVIDANYMLAHQYTALGQFDEAQQAWQQVRAEYEATGTWDGVRDTEYGIGNLAYLQGRYEQALEHFRRALDVQVEKMEFEPFGQWVAHNNLAAAYEALGRFEQVLESCETCEDLLDKLPSDDPMRKRLECYTSGNLGSAHRNLGNLDQAVEAYGRTLEIARETGEKSVESEVRHFLGRTLSLLGRLIEARTHLDESVALAIETSNATWATRSLALMGQLSLYAGDLKQVEEYLSQADEQAQAVGEVAGTAEIGLVRGDLLVVQERLDQAVAALTEVLGQAVAAHNEVERARALAALAAVEQELGQALAEDHAAEALELCDEMGLRPVRCSVLRTRARLLWPSQAIDALAAVDEALEVAEAMRAPLEAIAALGLRAELRAESDAAGAQADLAAAEQALAALRETADEAVAEAVRRRYLAVAKAHLAPS